MTVFNKITVCLCSCIECVLVWQSFVVTDFTFPALTLQSTVVSFKSVQYHPGLTYIGQIHFLTGWHISPQNHALVSLC